MLIVAGTARLRPDTHKEAVALAEPMAAATRAEPGCLEYRFSASLSDPTMVTVFERWESPSALEAHLEADHTARFGAELPHLLSEPPEVHRYEVTDHGSV